MPKSLRPILGLSVIKRSLGTKDPVVARAWAYALGARCAQMLSTARDAIETGMSKWDDDAVAKAMGQIQKNSGGGSVRPWEVEPPNGYRIRTDGSDKDNKDGLAELRAILESSPDVPPNPARWVAPTPVSTSRLSLADAIRDYAEVEALAMKPNTWMQRKRALDYFCKAIGPFSSWPS